MVNGFFRLMRWLSGSDRFPDPVLTEKINKNRQALEEKRKLWRERSASADSAWIRKELFDPYFEQD